MRHETNIERETYAASLTDADLLGEIVETQRELTHCQDYLSVLFEERRLRREAAEHIAPVIPLQRAVSLRLVEGGISE